MNRRDFFKKGALATIGTTMIGGLNVYPNTLQSFEEFKGKKAKNIIMMVSDGMSIGTLNMANLYSTRILGKTTHWIQLYLNNEVSRGMMDMASASSIVTDSAAASSSWGCGQRINNGGINISVNGEKLTPIWQKFKKAGKKAGIVTTVPATHATPAGFTVNMKSRKDQDKIAQEYLRLGYDVIMGGGDRYFNPNFRDDKRNLYKEFESKGYQIFKNKTELLATKTTNPILGIFHYDALPYAIDRMNNKVLDNAVPTLAEMTQVAIDNMKNNSEGFVLQVESGKVDWAAHANDIAGLIHEQLQFDDAIKVAIDFAKKDKNTLVIITTDHGNANPGVIYGREANHNFDSIAHYNASNEIFLNSITKNSSEKEVKESVYHHLGLKLDNDEVKEILAYYKNLEKPEKGLYNYKNLPYRTFAEIQQIYNSVGWISMDHSADYVEIAMYGPGQDKHLPFMLNTDLHHFMLRAAEVEE